MMELNEAEVRVGEMRRAAIEWRAAALREAPFLYDNIRGGSPGPPDTLVEPVVQVGPATIPPLILLLRDPDNDVAYLAVRALAHFGSAAVAPVLAFLKQEPCARMWAAMTLSRLRAPAVEPLLAALEEAHAQGDTRLRRAVLNALLPTNDPRMTEPLLRLLPELEEGERRDVVERFRLLKARNAIPALRIRLGIETAPRVRFALVQTLGWIDGVGSLDILLSVLKDRSSDVRHEAISHLGRLADARAIPALVRLLHGKRDRNEAGSALIRMGEIGLLPLAEALTDPDPAVRWCAVTRLNPSVIVNASIEVRSRVIALLRAAQDGKDEAAASVASRTLERLGADAF